MKLREVAYLFGFKPQPRLYGIERQEVDLGPPWGTLHYAQWLHPKMQDWAPTPETLREFAQVVKPGDFCLDIGAHVGDSTLPMAIAAGPDGCVLAMEPNRYLRPVLEANARLLGEKGNIDVLIAAATEKPGKYTFGYGDPGFCNGGDTSELSWWQRKRQLRLKVDGVNLADLLRSQYADRLNRLRLVKVDTEGHDAAVLTSIADILVEQRPYIQAEVFRHSPPDARKRLFDLLRGWGYTIHTVVDSGSIFGEHTTVDAICRVDQCDLFCFPPDAEVLAA